MSYIINSQIVLQILVATILFVDFVRLIIYYIYINTNW